MYVYCTCFTALCETLNTADSIISWETGKPMKKPGLTQKLKLREIELPNRIVLSPMQMYKASKHGQMTDWHLVHYGKYAYAKFGLIFTEVLCVEKRGRSTYSDAGGWRLTRQ